MRTPGAFHSSSPFSFKTERYCVVCPAKLRGMQEKFCSNRCRWAADDNARKTIERVGALLSRRELIRGSFASMLALRLHLESRPEPLGARREHTASVLHNLNILLSHKGPNDPEVRSFARVQADAVRLAFEAEPSRHIDDCRNYIRALEILRDAGVEDPYDQETLLRYAWTVVRFYHARREYLDLARSLQALANTYRLNEDDKNGKRFTRHARHILNDRFGKNSDLETLTFVHQSAFWDLRLTESDVERPSAEKKCSQIIELAGRVNTPAIWIETYREMAGHLGKDPRYEDKAHAAIERIRKIRTENPNLTSYGAPTLVRPEIELLLGSGRTSGQDKGIHLIETVYLDLYTRDRHVYYYRQLKKWNRKYHLSLQIPEPQYASPVLCFLPRGTPGA